MNIEDFTYLLMEIPWAWNYKVLLILKQLGYVLQTCCKKPDWSHLNSNVHFCYLTAKKKLILSYLCWS